jgi:hypothetical protein
MIELRVVLVKVTTAIDITDANMLRSQDSNNCYSILAVSIKRDALSLSFR